MKPIKFRAWDKDTKEMVVHDFAIANSGTVHNLQFAEGDLHSMINEHMAKINSLLQGTFWIIDISDWYAIDNYHIMQFTGAKDKNGKEIYDGDKAKIFGVIAEIKWSNKWCGWIFYSKEFPENKRDLPFSNGNTLNSDECEIIGNIYQPNPIQHN